MSYFTIFSCVSAVAVFAAVVIFVWSLLKKKPKFKVVALLLLIAFAFCETDFGAYRSSNGKLTEKYVKVTELKYKDSTGKECVVQDANAYQNIETGEYVYLSYGFFGDLKKAIIDMEGVSAEASEMPVGFNDQCASVEVRAGEPYPPVLKSFIERNTLKCFYLDINGTQTKIYTYDLNANAGVLLKMYKKVCSFDESALPFAVSDNGSIIYASHGKLFAYDVNASKTVLISNTLEEALNSILMNEVEDGEGYRVIENQDGSKVVIGSSEEVFDVMNGDGSSQTTE